MKYRSTKPISPIAEFANHAYEDHSFPKQSKDYYEITNYLELNGDYMPSMTIFDHAWDLYTQEG
jgi:uncharacterized protein YozE (UPF0346 family)